MISVFSMTAGPAPALLLLAALLAADARADGVTTAECKARDVWGRVRQYPTDSNATSLLILGCGLTEINPDTFTGLPNLESVHLRKNNLDNLNTAVFRDVPTLNDLWLDYNKLREPPFFNQLSCPNLTELYLDHNEMTGIYNAGTFSACLKLEKLYLHNNHIDFVHFYAFKGLTELRTLHLHNNKIRFISDQMFVGKGKLDRLYLYNNRITHLPPDFASNLKRAGVSLERFYFLDNPWHCVCLLELLADIKRAGVPYYGGWSYNGVRPECNYLSMREYPCRKIRELNFIVHGVR